MHKIIAKKTIKLVYAPLFNQSLSLSHYFLNESNFSLSKSLSPSLFLALSFPYFFLRPSSLYSIR